MHTVSIVGVGLIGASFALAIRKAGFAGSILGVSSPASIEAGKICGAIDCGVTLAEAAARSDLLYLSQPIESILETIPQLVGTLGEKCLVTDAGSTKLMICRTAARHLPAHQFLGGHPMAGREKRGAQSASADIFENRPYVLTPTVGGAHPNDSEFRDFLRSIGARVVEMSAEEHDQTVAFTSHLPQLLSTTLSSTLASEASPHILDVFGPGLIDMTRLALSTPEVWMSVLSTNQAAIDEAIGRFQGKLQQVREALNSASMADLFLQAAEFAAAVRSSKRT